MSSSYEQAFKEDLVIRRTVGKPLTLVYDDHQEQFREGTPLIDIVNKLEFIDLVFDGATAPSGQKIDEPSLIFYPAILYPGAKGVQTRMALFTATTKMAAPSFSLSHGPLDYEGTCTHSDVSKAARRIVQDPALFICHGCYVSGGNYIYLDQHLRRMMRKRWVEEQLRAGELASSLITALESYAGERRFGPKKIVQNPDYFRIHDSGDMLWGGKGYAQSWILVARHFRDKLFWAPSRDWPSRTFVEWQSKRPDNFIFRPSAFHVNDPAPRVQGLDKGSTAHFELDPVEAGLAQRGCPIYEIEGKTKTCDIANCRLCWTHPDESISYKAHGAGMSKKKLSRKNPGLEALYRKYQHSNPQPPFEGWLFSQGAEPLDFSREEWERMLSAQGMESAEISDYLEGITDWS